MRVEIRKTLGEGVFTRRRKTKLFRRGNVWLILDIVQKQEGVNDVRK